MSADTDRTSLLTAMRESILAMAGEPRLEPVLRRLVEGARELVDARYAAIGVPDDEGEGFGEFIYTGMSDALVAKLGPLPRQHGLLAAMLEEPAPDRAADRKHDLAINRGPDTPPRRASLLALPSRPPGHGRAAGHAPTGEAPALFQITGRADKVSIGTLAGASPDSRPMPGQASFLPASRDFMNGSIKSSGNGNMIVFVLSLATSFRVCK